MGDGGRRGWGAGDVAGVSDLGGGCWGGGVTGLSEPGYNGGGAAGVGGRIKGR